MFMLLTDDGRRWGHVILAALPAYTQYLVTLGTVRFQPTSLAMFFPLQWARVCLSVDSVEGKVMLVVDGQLVGEKEFKKEEIFFRQDSRFNIS